MIVKQELIKTGQYFDMRGEVILNLVLTTYFLKFIISVYSFDLERSAAHKVFGYKKITDLK